MNAEIDLPRRFLALHRTSIENFLEHAKPGDTLCLHLGDTSLLRTFVSSSSIERYTVELRVRAEGRDYVLAPADAASRRLVDLEEDKLRKAEAVHEAPKPVNANDNPSWSRFPLGRPAAIRAA